MNKNASKHPFHDVLTKNWDWAASFAKWETLFPQIQELEKARVLETGLGDRNRKLRTIYKQLALLRAEIAETQPADRYLLSDAKVILDTWKTFTDHWRALQHKAAWPVGPAGEKLKTAEKSAWEALIQDRK